VAVLTECALGTTGRCEPEMGGGAFTDFLGCAAVTLVRTGNANFRPPIVKPPIARLALLMLF